MIRIIRTLLLVVLLALAWSVPPQAAPDSRQLVGEDVAEIGHTFLNNHYSQERFDDAHSRRMFQRYVAQFDPEHYYFLRSDMEGFRERYAERLDDMIRQGNIGPAFVIFDRFKQRLAERTELVTRLLDEEMDLHREGRVLADRSTAPHPAEGEVEELWRRKIQFELLQQTADGVPEDEARERLRERYNGQKLRTERYTHNDIVSAYLNAFTNSYDPHSSYLSPDDLENFNIALRLSLEGIGATLRWENGYTVISSILPGGAAAKEGSLKSGDKIIAVAQGTEGAWEDVRSVRLIDVVNLIRGERGTVVRLTVLRENKNRVEERKEISIVRDKIELKDGEAQSQLVERTADDREQPYRVGVINLPSFYVDFAGRRENPEDYKSSSRDVARILRDFVDRGVDGVVLDLRNNGGGGLDEAVSLSGLFLPKGPVVMVKDLRGRISIIANPHSAPLYRGPLVVLTNRHSASASEILAGAMQDYGRGVIVGDRSTFGKGTVQNVITLEEGLGALKTTVAKFYRPGSASTQNRGVLSDIVLPSLNNHLEIGESALPNPLPWDAVRRATFRPWGEVEPYLPTLRARTEQRLADNPSFTEVREAVERYLESRKGQRYITVSDIVDGSGDNGDAPDNGEEMPPRMGDREMPTPEDDPYLNESVNILLDYIRLQQDQSVQQMTYRQP